jgi:predicted nucleic acid-binding protein
VNQITVCDTGPLIHLSEAQAIDLLKLAGGIFIPPTVATEFKRNLASGRLPAWIKVRRLTAPFRAQVLDWVKKKYVDLGEAEAIGLTLQLPGDWFLTDDAEARQFAESLEIEVHGSIGVLLLAVATGHIEDRVQAHQILENLKRSSLWISERVITEAAKAIDELTPEE